MSLERGPGPARLSAAEMDALRGDVLASSYLRGEFRSSTLGETGIWFDKYRFLTQPSILRRLARAMAAVIEDDTDRIAAAELGAVPLAVAVGLETGLPYVVLRREPRVDADVEGEISPGDRVVLIEDVVATGQHASRYLERLRGLGLHVPQVVCVLDRDEGARSALERLDCRLTSLFAVPSEMRVP